MGNHKGTKILVVDDDKLLADNLVEYLGRLGYLAEGAYGGQEALDLFQKAEFGIVISDMVMPEMNGLELLKAVRAIDARAVFLVITGYATIESAVKAIKEGAYDFVPKPFRMEELEVIISRALERHALSKRLGVFRGLTLALLISVPLWLALGIILSYLWK